MRMQISMQFIHIQRKKWAKTQVQEGFFYSSRCFGDSWATWYWGREFPIMNTLLYIINYTLQNPTKLLLGFYSQLLKRVPAVWCLGALSVPRLSLEPKGITLKFQLLKTHPKQSPQTMTRIKKFLLCQQACKARRCDAIWNYESLTHWQG